MLFLANQKALELWELCHKTRTFLIGVSGVSPEKLNPANIKAMCDGMNAKEEFEKVINIEYVAYPRVVKDFNESRR